MPAILMTGAAGQGKTHAAISEIKRLTRQKLFGKIWVLLPTDLQIGAFRARLLDEIGEEAHFGVEFFHFYDLYARLLEIVVEPRRHVKNTARFRILRHVLAEVEGNLWHFHRIQRMPGFVSLAAAFIEELKQARITPEQFDQVARTAKDHDLSLIYGGYQAFLQSNALVDGEGEGWLALARLQESPNLKLDVDLLIVDGFDQFNLVQAQLLSELANHLPTALLTLTYQPERAETAHRRFAQTRTRLLDSGANWIEKTLLDQPSTPRRPALELLTARLFDIHPEPAAPVAPTVDDGAITLIEAPDRLREVQTVMRRVKSLVVESGVEPEQIAILARDLEPYAAYLLETAPAYGIPVAVRRGSSLSQNPAVAAFLSLIDLASDGFPRRVTMDLLRNAYLECPDLVPAQIGLLDRISREQIVVRGRVNWLDAVEKSGRVRADEDEDWSAGPSPEQAGALRTGLERFFERVTPPEQATARDYVRWCEALIGPDSADAASDDENPAESGHFRVIERIRHGARWDLVARDLLALACLKRAFLEVLSAYELIDAWSPVGWDAFRLDLRIAIDNTMINPLRTSNRLGRVLLASVYEARGLPHDHIFLMGLSEGEFPSRIAEDVLYTDDERRQMRDQGVLLLTRTEMADESSLFYEVTALARQSLTLTRPYVDDKGNGWPASPYWRAVQAVIDITPERLPMAAAPTLDDAARPSEVMIALAQALNGKPTPAVFAVHNWLIAQDEIAPRWVNALRCRAIESRRTSPAVPHDAYSGRLSDPALRQLVGEILGSDYVWSASQFNDYGTCPYKFFARRLLKLEPLKEPEEGMDNLQLGVLYHEILEHTYRRIAEEGLAILPENGRRARQILDEACHSLLPGAPKRLGFRAPATWQQEQDVLRRKLGALVDADFSGAMHKSLGKLLDGVRYAYRQEVRFGFDDLEPIIVDGEAGPLRVRGAIDRMDVVDGEVVLFDYKSGSGSISKGDMVEGRNVQMMLYILAGRQLLEDKVVGGGAFWHIGRNALSGGVSADDPQIEDARHSLHERIAQARQGIFVNVPSRLSGGHCSNACDFSQLCRHDRASGRKEIRSDE